MRNSRSVGCFHLLFDSCIFMASEFGGVTPSKEVRAIYLDRYLSVLKNLREKYEEMPPRPQRQDKNKF